MVLVCITLLPSKIVHRFICAWAGRLGLWNVYFLDLVSCVEHWTESSGVLGAFIGGLTNVKC